jgi:hypothetical protein
VCHIVKPAHPACLVVWDILEEHEEPWIVKKDIPEVQMVMRLVSKRIGTIEFPESASSSFFREKDIQKLQERKPGCLLIVEPMSPNGLVNPHVWRTRSWFVDAVGGTWENRRAHMTFSQL